MNFCGFLFTRDWRAEAEKGYRRLCPGQSVGLRHAGLVVEWVDSVTEGGKVRFTAGIQVI